MNDENWHFFDYEPQSMKTTYVQILEDGTIRMRKTIPMWLAQQIIEKNKAQARQFDENGGWSGAKNGAVVASVPDHIDQHFKELSGYDPVNSGGWYDRDKYASLLDDPDYSALRTGGGKIGKHRVMI